MRVPTKGHGQTTDTQSLALREYAQRRGFEIAGEYRDEGISGSKDSRPALDRLMKDAKARNQQLMFDEHRLGHDGMEASWPRKPDDGNDQMNE
jgi:DNA invertase Pin-like site-specific DNA recombinase